MSDDEFEDYSEFEGFENGDYDPDAESEPLDEAEADLVRQDLVDLEDFQAVFTDEGYRGVSIFCRDCVEDHYYTWDILRENLTQLLATGETPVHEPPFAPEPSQYVPWDYAHGYVDAMREAGVFERANLSGCPRCGLELGEARGGANFCPRCGNQLLGERLRSSLGTRLEPAEVEEVLRETGLPD